MEVGLTIRLWYAKHILAKQIEMAISFLDHLSS